MLSAASDPLSRMALIAESSRSWTFTSTPRSSKNRCTLTTCRCAWSV
jgi:hypothetical protein